jgi:hypothetical protein
MLASLVAYYSLWRYLRITILIFGKQVSALNFSLRRSQFFVPFPDLFEKGFGILPLVVVRHGQYRTVKPKECKSAVPKLLFCVDIVRGFSAYTFVREYELAVFVRVGNIERYSTVSNATGTDLRAITETKRSVSSEPMLVPPKPQ